MNEWIRRAIDVLGIFVCGNCFGWLQLLMAAFLISVLNGIAGGDKENSADNADD